MLVIKMKTTKSIITSNDEVSKLIKLVIIITVVFAVFYGVTIFLTIEEEQEVEKTPATIQYDNILTSTIFNRVAGEYYVVLTTSDENISAIYSSYMGVYIGKTDALRVYYSNLNNPFNTKYISETSNIVNDLNALKFSGDTLIKVKDGNIIESYEGKDKIIEKLKELTKEEE